MNNDFKQSIKSDYPETINHISNINHMIVEKLNNIKSTPDILYSGEIEKIWEYERQILEIGFECQEILKSNSFEDKLYNNEQLNSLVTERKELERCVDLICDKLYTKHDKYKIDSELILRNIGKHLKYMYES